MADGKVVIETDLDNDGIKDGLKEGKKDIENGAKSMKMSFRELSIQSGKSVDELKHKAAELASEYQKQGMNIPNSYKKAYDEMGVYSERTVQKMKRSSEEILEVEEQSSENISERWEEAFEKIERESDEAKKEIERDANDESEVHERASQEAADGWKKSFSKIGDLAKKGFDVVKKAITATTAALTASGTAAVVVGSNFEAGMSKVSAISGAVGDDLAKLAEKAKQMGATTKFSAAEAASAFEYMAMAGWKTSDMLSGIDGIMNLAAASGEDLAVVSDIVTDAITAFGLSAADSSHFADVLAAASSNANTNVSMLGESFKYVAPIAGAMKYSAEDTSLALGLMANASIKGSMAGTSLKTSLANLASPTESMAQIMEQYKISLTNTDGSMKSLKEVIEVLRDKMGGLDEATQTAAASTLFGKEAMAGMLAIINASEEDYQKLASAVNNADGTAQNMSNTMQNNLKGSITVLKSSLEGLGIQVYESIESKMKNAADVGIQSVERLSKAYSKDGLKGAVSEAGEILGDFVDDLEDSNDVVKGTVKPLKNMTEKALDLGKKALPPTIKALELTVKHLDKFVPLAVAGYTALKGYGVVKNVTNLLGGMTKAWQTASKAVDAYNVIQLACTMQGVRSTATLTAGQAAVGLLTGKVSLATAAQAAWNAVMNANPIALVITSVGALAAAIGVCKLMTDDASNATSKLSQEQKKIIENSKDTIQNIREEAAARQENINLATSEIDCAESLWNELQQCVDSNGEIKAGYEARAQYISGELADALGIEINLVDGVIQNYKELEKSVQDVIAAKQAEAVLDAMKTNYANAMKEQADLASDLSEKYNALTDSKEKMAKIEAELAEEGKNYIEITSHTGEVVKRYSDRYYELRNELDETKATLETNQAAFEASSEAMKDNEKVISDYNLILEASMSGSTDTINNALAQIQSGIDTTLEASSNAALEQAKNTGETLLNVISAQEQGIAQIQQATIDSTAESMGISLNTIRTESESMKKLLEEAGEDGSKKMIEAMIEADLAGNMSVEAKSGMEAFITAFDGIYAETKEIGSESMQGYDSGITSEETNVQRDAKKVVQKVKKDGLESVDTGPSGKQFTTGFSGERGMTAPDVVKSLRSAASGIAQTALIAMKNKLEIHSPSRASGRLAKFTGQGFVNELKNQIPEVEKTGESLAESALHGMDIEYQLGRMRAAMNAEKSIISANITNKVLHEFVMGNQRDFQGLGERILELKKHIDNINIHMQLEGKAYLDKREAGYILAPEINRRLGEFLEIEGRG